METADLVKAAYTGSGATAIRIGEIGLGAGVVDRLKELECPASA